LGLEGPCKQKIRNPACLVSLTVPKLCASQFKGEKHILGGRFVPPEMAERLKLNIPKYPGTDVIVELPSTLIE
jgi:NAD(P)H-hydrate epimerase